MRVFVHGSDLLRSLESQIEMEYFTVQPIDERNSHICAVCTKIRRKNSIEREKEVDECAKEWCAQLKKTQMNRFKSNVEKEEKREHERE